jgi:hypothetical protein
MSIKPELRNFCWTCAAGAIVFLAVMLVVLHFQRNQNPADLIAFKAKRVELVDQIRLAVASSSEAEKSAVMATTDRESQEFADEARGAAAAAEQKRLELEKLLQTGGTRNEKDLLAQFSRVFADFRQIDNDLLALAVRNTNLKAQRLAFGPAAEAVKEMDAALTRIVSEYTNSVSRNTVRVNGLADDARIRVLRIQTLLFPHIAEESDRKMDELETLMAKEDREIRGDMENLSILVRPTGNSGIETAKARYDEFARIRLQIIKLSRENTNVRSLTISLNQKRKVTVLCQDALSALEQAIRQEPVPEAINPRSFRDSRPSTNNFPASDSSSP